MPILDDRQLKPSPAKFYYLTVSHRPDALTTVNFEEQLKDLELYSRQNRRFHVRVGDLKFIDQHCLCKWHY